ncbi:MAG TPA: hypothetical protein VHE35_03215 [Kofleriaceae bacterium]|nr:hypothetical protein [Kofleriaceae bacterium]
MVQRSGLHAGVAGMALGLALLGGCGTYSLMRPAETMREGRVELAAGIAASSIGEANTVVHAAYAITDDLEIDAQNEVWNTFVELRYGLLHERDDGLSLAVGAGGGEAITLVSAAGDALDGDDADNGAAGLVSVAIGKRFGPVDLTLGNRTFVQVGSFFMSSTRAQARFAIGDHFGFILEGGATVHAPIREPDLALAIGEGTGGFWVGF